MKVRTGLLMLVATGAMWAQSAPNTAPAKTSTAAPAKTSASAATAVKGSDTKTKAKASKKSSAAAKPAAAAPAAAASSANAQAKPAKEVHTSAARRDPFLSPIQTRTNEPINCGTGK